ncbi:hypothetical protein GCM10010388_06210 [Streptomyces mauvecolor]
MPITSSAERGSDSATTDSGPTPRIRQLGVFEDHRDRVRRRRHLLLEQAGHGDLRGRHGRAVAAAQDQLALGRLQDVDQADPHRRVRDQLAQHPHEAGRHRLDRRSVEQVGRVLDEALGLAAGGLGDLGQVEEQVELGGAGDDRHEVHPQARQVEVGLREVLPGEHHLEQRVVRGGAVRVEELDQALEGGVLVAVRAERLVLHLGDQLVEGGVAREFGAQHPGVDEEADQVVEGVVGAARDRRADRDVVARSQLVQQDREDGLHDHGDRHVALARQLLDGGEQLGLDGELDHVAAVAGLRRPRPVGGQLERLRDAGELLVPVAGLVGEDALGVVGLAEQLALPDGVVDVLDREFRELGHLARAAGRVGGGDLADQRGHRLAVAGDVVDDQRQDVLLRAGRQDAGAHRDLAVEREGVLGGLGDRRVQVAVGDLDHGHVQDGLAHRHDQLERHALGVLAVDRAQALVPVHDVLERGGERRCVEVAGEPEVQRDVVRRRGALELVDEPQAALGEGQRQLLGPPLQAGQRGADLDAGREVGGELGDRRRTEDHLDRDLRAEHRTDPADQAGREQRVPAEGEEVVVDADPLQAEHLAEQARQGLLVGGARRPVGAGGELRLGQGGPVQLAVGHQRQPVQGHEDGGDHEVGQPLGGGLAQLLGRDASGLGGDDVGDELLARVAARSGPGDDGGLGDRRVRHDRGLDLAGLDAEAAHLDLGVAAADVFEAALAVPAGHVAGAVHPRTGCAVGVGDEALGGQVGAAAVAAADVAADVELSRNALRDRLEAGAQDVGAHVAERRADGGAAEGGRGAGGGEGGGVERLGLAVGVDDLHAGEGLAGPVDQVGGQGLAGEDQDVDLRPVGDLVEEFGEGGGDGGDDIAAPPVPLAEDEDVADDLDGAAGHQGREDLERGDVEVDRRAGERLAAGTCTDALGELGDAVDDVVVGDGDALGGAAGARGVHDVRQVVGDQGAPAVAVSEVGDACLDVQVDVVEVDVTVEQHRCVGLGQDGDRLGVGEDQLGLRLAEDELQAVARVLRVDRQVGRPRLEDREEPDDEFGRARQRERDDRLRARSPPDQFPGEPVGAGVDLRIRQLGGFEDHRDRVRRRRHLLLEERGDRGVRGEGLGAVQLLNQMHSFSRLQDVDPADRDRRVGDQLAQDPQQPARHDLDGVAVQDVLLELEGQAQVRVGVRHDGQRVVGAGRGADAGEGDAGRRVGVAEPVAVHRVRLEHHQGVEERLEAGGLVDLGEAVVVVVQEGGLAHLQVVQDLGEGVALGVLDAHRERVDEHADDGVDAGDGRGTAGDGGAEHDVLAAGELAEQHRPGALDQGVDSDAELGGAPVQLADLVKGQRDLDVADAGAAVLGGRARQQDGRLLDPGELLGPGAGRLVVVQAGEVDEEVLEAADPRQHRGVARRPVQAQQVLHEDRQGPAVEQDVVGGQDELGLVVLGAHQGQAQHGRGEGVEAPAVVLDEELVEGFGAGLLVEAAQVDVLPGHLDAVDDDLDLVAREVVDERGPQVGVPVQHGLSRGAHAGGVDAALDVEGHLHLVGVPRVVVQHRVEQQAGLERGERPHVRQARVALLPHLDVLLGDVHQRQVRGGQAARPGGGCVQREGLQGLEPQPDELLDVGAGEQARGETRRYVQLGAPVGVDDHRVDFERRHGRHVLVEGGGHLGDLGEAEAAQVLRHVGGGEAAQVVEADLAGGELLQLGGGLLVEVAQQSEAEALVGDGQELFLDGLDDAARGGARGERLVEVEARRVQAYREHRGEPADRGGQVGAGHHVLFAAVALQLDEGGGLLDAAGPAPLGDGEGEGGQQAVVDAAVEGGGHLGQEGVGDVRGELHVQVVQRRTGVDGRVERAGAEQRVGAVQDRAPQREFRGALGAVGLVDQCVRPAAHRGARLRQCGGLAVLDLLPGGGEVGEQDAPGHSVDDGVVQGDDQAAGDGGIGRVEPHELGHHAGGGVQAAGRGIEFGLGARPPGLVPGAVAGDAADQCGRVDGAGRVDAHRAAVLGEDGRAQDVVPVEDRVHCGGQARLVDAQREFGKERHGEPVVSAAQLQHVLGDGEQREQACAAALELLQDDAAGAFGPGDVGQVGDGAALEDLPGGDLQALGAGPGDDLDGADGVAADGEEVVVDADPVQAQDLGVHAGQDLLGVAARRAVLAAGELGLRQRLAVQLAVGHQRQPVEDDEGGGDHEVGQPLRGEGPEVGGLDAGAEVVAVLVAGEGGDDVADELLGGVGALALAGDDGGLADAGVGEQRRLDLAGFDAEAAHLDLGVAAADVFELAVAVPAGHVAGAVHPVAGGAEQVGQEALEGQVGAAEVAACHVARDVELSRDTRGDRAQGRAEHVGAHVAQRAADRGVAAAFPLLAVGDGEGGGVERLGLAVGVDDAYAGERLADLGDEGGREGLSGEDQGVDGDAVGDLVDELAEGGRHGGDDVAVPALAVREDEDVADDLDGAAVAEVGEDLERGDVEVDRRAGERLAAGTCADALGEVGDAVDDVGVGDGDALGGAAGARGVHDVRQVLLCQVSRAVGVGEVVRAFGEVDVAEEEHRGVGLRQDRDRLGVGEDQLGLRLAEDELQAVARVLRVDRQGGAAGLQDREEADDELRRARQRQGDDRLGADSGRHQLAGEAVGAGVDLRIRQLGVFEDHRDRVRRGRRLLLEERRDGDLGDLGGGGVERGELLALGRGEDLQGADGPGGVGDQLGQDPYVALADALDGVAVEQVGGVLDGAARAVALGGRGHVELQVELGALGAQLLEVQPGLEARQVDLGAADVLPGEEHLEQRVVGGGALRRELVDQHLERGVLVLVRAERLVLHLVEQALEGGVAGQLDPQHPGVDEEADQVGEVLVDAARDGRADRDVGAGAQVVQEHGERGLQDHRDGQALVLRQLLDGGPQFGLDVELDGVAAVAGRRRADPVERQLERLVHAGQLLAPVGELAVQHGLGVVLVAEQVALPQRVVRVLDRQVLPPGGLAPDAGGVGLGQVPQERHRRLAVRRDVVEQEDQDVPVRAVLQNPGPDGDLRVQVERVVDRFGNGVVHLVRPHRHDRHVEDGVLDRQDPLVRDALLLEEDGAQALVPAHHVPERRGERRGVQVARQPQRQGDVVGRRGPLETVEEPQASLCIGQGDHFGSTPWSSCADGAGSS